MYGKDLSRELLARISVMDLVNQDACMWWYLNDGWLFAYAYREAWGEFPCERDLMELLKLPQKLRTRTMDIMLAVKSRIE